MLPASTLQGADGIKKLQALLAFASTIPARFSKTSDTTIEADLRKHIQGLPLLLSKGSSLHSDADEAGTELWNLSTRLRRQTSQHATQVQGTNVDDAIAARARTVCHLRVFAFFLLDAAASQVGKSHKASACVRLMKVALKAGKMCIASKEMDLATKTLMRAADYEVVLGKQSSEDDLEEITVASHLRVEYHAARIMLAWKQNRMDIAEHMFAGLQKLQHVFDASLAEEVADLLYEVGSDLMTRRNAQAAIRWLERASEVLSSQELESLSFEAGELRLCILQSMAKCYTKLAEADAPQKAHHMLQLLELDYPNKTSVLLLKLEILDGKTTFDPEDYASSEHIIARLSDTLTRRDVRNIIQRVTMNDGILKIIMHHLLKLKDMSAHIACGLLDEVIRDRLSTEENAAWLEKALITRIWMSSTSECTSSVVQHLHSLCDECGGHLKMSLSVQATHAAHILMWKVTEICFAQEQYELSEQWCRLCLHPLFEKAGDDNKAKIARKMIACAHARHDIGAARDIYHNLPQASRDDSVTRYLMYKAEIGNEDMDFLTDCLDVICRSSSEDLTLLYACVIDAQAARATKVAIAALDRVLEQYEGNTNAEIHLPALIRIMVKMLSQELVADDGKLDPVMLSQICKLLHRASDHAKESERRPTTPARAQWTKEEFEWFTKHAYNWSMKYCAEMPPEQLVVMLKMCISFLKIFTRTGSDEEIAGFVLRQAYCYFLLCCALTTLARAEDETEQQLQRYTQARQHGSAFRSLSRKHGTELEASSKSDLATKHQYVVKVELEAALKLGQWDEMEELFDQCFSGEEAGDYGSLADLVLVIHSHMLKTDVESKHRDKIFPVLQTIINRSWKQSGNDLAKLSRWIRCLFQLTRTSDERLSLRCLEQAADIAAAHHAQENCYPSVELAWLATTAFNTAVDHYVQEDDARCREWAEKALKLAEWASDGGQLRQVLMEKYSGLTWGHA